MGTFQPRLWCVFIAFFQIFHLKEGTEKDQGKSEPDQLRQSTNSINGDENKSKCSNVNMKRFSQNCKCFSHFDRQFIGLKQMKRFTSYGIYDTDADIICVKIFFLKITI